MPLFFILLICSLAAFIFGYSTATFIALGFGSFTAALIWSAGGFQRCPKCGSRLTSQIQKDVPDFSYGKPMHTWAWQSCWNPKCWKKTMIKGLKVEVGPLLDEQKAQ